MEMTNDGMTDDELPEAWQIVPFLSVADLFRGVTYTKNDARSEPFAGSVPVLRANNIQDRRFDLTDLVHVPRRLVSDKQMVTRGDVVVATSSGSISVVGKAARALEDMNAGFGAFCGLLRPKTGINPAYFGFFFSTDDYRRTVSALARGVNINNLKREHFESLQIPIAPEAEQKRIAEKLEAVLGRVDACRARLDRVPALLKRFRQSVLAAATSGQLTEDWREVNETATDTAEMFLEQLLAARRATWEQTPKAAAGRRYVEPEKMDSSDLPPIPASWCWASVDAVSRQVTDGEHIQPPYQNVGLPMLSAKHVRDGFVDPEGAGLIGEAAFGKALERCAPQNGDLLIVSVGATTGRVAIVENCPPFAIVRSVLLVKPLISNRFLLRCLQSSWCYQRMTKASGASAQAHLYIKDTKRLPVPIPPLAEQVEIVRRVEALFALADRIEARLSSAQKTVERLTPAVLAKAFRGHLVPQDPTDEPASVLLARLRDEPAAPRLRRPHAVLAPITSAPPRSPVKTPKASRVPVSKTAASSAPPRRVQAPRKAPTAPTPITELDRNDLVALLREVVAAHGPCDRATLIRQAAYALNYQRAGSAVSAEIDHAIRAAVRRRVVLHEGQELRVNRASIEQMEGDDRDFMKEQFLAAISQRGRVWIERADAARLYAHWFGFRRTGSQIQDRVKSLINGLLRNQRLESSGTRIRRL